MNIMNIGNKGEPLITHGKKVEFNENLDAGENHDAGENRDVSDITSDEYFHYIKIGDVKNIERIIDGRLIDLNVVSSFSFNALHYSAIYGRVEIMELLLDNGIDLHKTNFRKMSALHFAAFNNNYQIFEKLISLGCNPFSGNDVKKTALDLLNDNPALKEVISMKYDKKIFSLYERPSFPTKIEFTKVDYFNTNLILCPGFGSQKKGMIRAYAKNPMIQELFREANMILGFDIWEKIETGENLTQPLVGTISVYLTSLAAFIYKSSIHQKDIVGTLLGYSMGEFTALAISGIVDWRVLLMKLKIIFLEIEKNIACHSKHNKNYEKNKAKKSLGETSDGETSDGETSDGKGSDKERSDADEKVKYMNLLVFGEIQDIKKYGNEFDFHIVNRLSSKIYIIVGNESNINNFKNKKRKSGIHKTQTLPIQIPLHSPYLCKINSYLKSFLMDLQIKRPKCNVFSSSLGKKIENGNDVCNLLSNILIKEIDWHSVTNHLISDEYNDTIKDIMELPPGKNITWFMKMSNSNFSDKMVKFNSTNIIEHLS